MNLLTRQPLSTLPHLPLFSQLSEEMNRFFEQDLTSLGGRWETLAGQWQPNIDVEKKENEYVVRADIPGVNAKDIKVSMDNGMLTIEGKRETKTEENKENYHCIERSCGNFYRAIALPEAVDSENIKAHNHNGVLEITIPKSTAKKQHFIQVLAD